MTNTCHVHHDCNEISACTAIGFCEAPCMQLWWKCHPFKFNNTCCSPTALRHTIAAQTCVDVKEKTCCGGYAKVSSVERSWKGWLYFDLGSYSGSVRVLWWAVCNCTPCTCFKRNRDRQSFPSGRTWGIIGVTGSGKNRHRHKLILWEKYQLLFAVLALRFQYVESLANHKGLVIGGPQVRSLRWECFVPDHWLNFVFVATAKMHPGLRGRPHGFANMCPNKLWCLPDSVRGHGCMARARARLSMGPGLSG